MGVWDKLTKSLEKIWAVKPREYQEMVDLGHVCMLTCLRKELLGVDASSNEARAAAVEKVAKRMEGWSTSEQRKVVQQNISEQLIKAFEILKSSHAEASMITSTSQISQDSASSDLAQDGMEQGYEELLRSLLRARLGYAPRPGPSTCGPGSGRGLLLAGRAEMGDVLALYPGAVHLREHLRDPLHVQRLFPDPDFFVYTRYDDVCIDARAAGDDGGEEEEEGGGLCHPLALGHLANHPPRGQRPNAAALAYDFPSDTDGPTSFPENLRPFIPNFHCKPPTLLGTPDRSAFMQSVVFVATRRIEHEEEILINYRFNPKFELPKWYHPIDEEQDRRRWD